MASASVSALLFARDYQRVAAFYRDVFNASVVAEDSAIVRLHCSGFVLTIHQIPAEYLEPGAMGSPPERRELAAVRLDFPVNDVEGAREAAKRHGGQIDANPPPWAGGRTTFFLGFDPEGNVIGVKSTA